MAIRQFIFVIASAIPIIVASAVPLTTCSAADTAEDGAITLLQLGAAGSGRLPRATAPAAPAAAAAVAAAPVEAASAPPRVSAPLSASAGAGPAEGASSSGSSDSDGDGDGRSLWLRYGVAPALLQTIAQIKDGDGANATMGREGASLVGGDNSGGDDYILTLLLIGGVACIGAVVFGMYVKDQWQSPQVARAGAEPLAEQHLLSTALSLCGEALIVPKEKRFECQVPKRFRRERQVEGIDITSSPQRGRRKVFKVWAAEGEQESNPRILIEGHHHHVDGGQPLAYIDTGPLWDPRTANDPDPKLNMYKGDGSLFGTLQKRGEAYEICRGFQRLVVFSGDFSTHDVTVSQADGRELGRARASDDESYQVVIPAGVDAGAVVLGLLAIDKCEAVTSLAGAGTWSQ